MLKFAHNIVFFGVNGLVADKEWLTGMTGFGVAALPSNPVPGDLFASLPTLCYCGLHQSLLIAMDWLRQGSSLLQLRA